MPKYDHGDKVLCYCDNPRECKDGLYRYNDTVVTVHVFEGCFTDKRGTFRNDGDWYIVIAEDGHLFACREKVLHKLPPVPPLLKALSNFYVIPRIKKQHAV